MALEKGQNLCVLARFDCIRRGAGSRCTGSWKVISDQPSICAALRVNLR